MSYYTLEFDFTVSEQSIKSYISSDKELSECCESQKRTDGHTICMNCVIFNCTKERTIQICIGMHEVLMKMGLLDDDGSLNDTVMESIVMELAHQDIQFNPNEQYFVDTVMENDTKIIIHSIRIPYEGVQYHTCDTVAEALAIALQG